MKLTDLSIQKLKSPDKGQRTYFEDNGFGVRVSQGGTKTFVIVQGKERKWTTLGRYPDMSLKDARLASKKAQVLSAPISTRKTVSGALQGFLEASQAKNRPATTANYKLFLSRLSKTYLDEVSRADVGNTAHSVMAAKIFFNWCMRQGYIDKNPFQFERVSYGERSRVLSNTELRQVWEYEAPPFSDHLKLLILTGQRRSQYKTFTVQNDTIVFPKDVMKGKREHTIPLTPMVKEVFDRLQPFNGWSKAKAKMDKTVLIPHWTIHDLRRTFATKHAELGTPVHVIEKILDHQSGSISGVASIYNRYSYLKEAREALEKYEEWLTTIVA